MISVPDILGLAVCDHVIIEERTKKFSLIGNFSGFSASSFPALVQPFSIFAVLTDGLGNGTMTVSIQRLETDEEIYAFRGPVHFPDKLLEMRLHVRVRDCVLPAPGPYQVTLTIDGEFIALRVIRARHQEE